MPLPASYSDRTRREIRIRSLTLAQVKIALARDLVQPVQFIHEDLARADDTGTVIEKLFRSDLQALHDRMKVLDRGAMDRAVATIGRTLDVLSTKRY